MVRTVSIKELRPSLPKVIRNIDKKLDRYIVTKRGQPVAVMLGIDDYESLLETLDVLSDKEAMKRIERAERDVKMGRTRSWESIRKELGRV